MEIPVISRMSDLEASISSLNSPASFISRFLSLLDLGKSSNSSPHRFWKWGALFIALLYTFTSIASRLKILALHHWRSRRPFASLSNPLLSINLYDDDVSSDDEVDGGSDEDHARPPCSSDSEDEDEFEHDLLRRRGKLRRRRQRSFGERLPSLTDLLTCNGVVKLWEDTFSTTASKSDTISILDLDKNSMIGSILGRFPAVAMPSPSVVLSAVSDNCGKLGVKLWDVRARRRRPAVQAEWRTRRPVKAVVGVGAGGVNKIYVRGEVEGEELVGDMRNVNSPLSDFTEYDEDTLWGAR
ncbi:hypothetical protein Dimus_014693 [Dionaea muscipula]